MRNSIILLTAVAALALAGCGENEANKAHKKAVSTNSNDINLRLARASEDAGDYPSAEKMYRQAASRSDDPQVYVELAGFYDRRHGEQQALEALNKAMQMAPDNTDIMRLAANAHIKLGEPGEALKIVNDALAIKGNDALLYNTKGVALDMLGRYTHARNAYSTALDLDPGDAMTFNANLGMSYISSGNYAKAIHLLQPLADAPDATPQIRQNLSLAYGLSGDSEKAVKLASQDIPGKDAEENMRFYKLFSDRHPGGALPPPPPVPDKVMSIPPIP